MGIAETRFVPSPPQQCCVAAHPREADVDELVWSSARTPMLLSRVLTHTAPGPRLPSRRRESRGRTRAHMHGQLAWEPGIPGEQARTVLTVCRLLESSSRRAVAEVLRGMQGDALAARGSVPPPLAPKPGITAGAAERARSGDSAPGQVAGGLES